MKLYTLYCHYQGVYFPDHPLAAPSFILHYIHTCKFLDILNV